jgi:hypothetical protein
MLARFKTTFVAALSVGLLWALQECGRSGRLALDDLHELPSLFAPLVEDFLKGVGDERNSCVFPFLHVGAPPVVVVRPFPAAP